MPPPGSLIFDQFAIILQGMIWDPKHVLFSGNPSPCSYTSGTQRIFFPWLVSHYNWSDHLCSSHLAQGDRRAEKAKLERKKKKRREGWGGEKKAKADPLVGRRNEKLWKSTRQVSVHVLTPQSKVKIAKEFYWLNPVYRNILFAQYRFKKIISSWEILYKKNPGVPCWLSGLRIWCCHCCGLGSWYGTGLIPVLGTSTCHGHGQKSTFLTFKKRKKNTIWYHLNVESKIWYEWTYLQNRNRSQTWREDLWLPRGWRMKVGWMGSLELAVANYYIYFILFYFFPLYSMGPSYTYMYTFFSCPLFCCDISI